MKELAAKIEEAKSKIQTLTEAIEDANEMVTEIREVGKEENKVAVKDAQETQQAVAQATSVLETSYKESGMIEKKSYELMQKEPVKLPETPSTWEASYTGVTDPTEQPDGIIAVLKKVSADFEKMEAQTKAQEESDLSLFEEVRSLKMKLKRLTRSLKKRKKFEPVNRVCTMKHMLTMNQQSKRSLMLSNFWKNQKRRQSPLCWHR